jgi:hypothetical protein
MSQVIKDARGITLGRIATDPSGRQRAISARGLTIGYFDPKTNKTTDARGLKVADGNVLGRTHRAGQELTDYAEGSVAFEVFPFAALDQCDVHLLG